MATDHLNMGLEPTPETSFVSAIPQKTSSVQYDVHIMSHILSQPFYRVSFVRWSLRSPLFSHGFKFRLQHNCWMRLSSSLIILLSFGCFVIGQSLKGPGTM